ncbi:hypothetical protein Agabi119p4_3882 [Agaricus bisporus var. burnettii]|uniref:Uncharacterized protein n=1 Tax=Agaricus bisporus var. burnettii TaxID=192524 RepID=A0A8H7F5S3_AGABI|nr:hypothetical protein Agabi119p4_3882 [Agaricus bisporus var. burnettii]
MCVRSIFQAIVSWGNLIYFQVTGPTIVHKSSLRCLRFDYIVRLPPFAHSLGPSRFNCRFSTSRIRYLEVVSLRPYKRRTRNSKQHI